MKLVAAALAMIAALSAAAQDKPFAIAIHGGPGTIRRTMLTPEREAAYRGVIVLDRSGGALFSFTTEGMYRGLARGSAKPEILVFR